MLEVKELSRNFGQLRAVREVSFKAEQGEVLGFLGPNGAGKTTTMRMITGFLPPSSGTALIAGHDIVKEPIAAKKLIGYLPENAPVYADMTVWNYLSFIAEVRGFYGREKRKVIENAIEECRLERVAYQTVGTLSKGYNQRVCMAQALLHDPPLLILDEPTDGLDPNQKHLVRGMIRAMSSNKIIVISTHLLEEVEALCTRAIIIKEGALVANGAPGELKAKSKLHGAVELTLKKPLPDLKAALEAIPAVGRVEMAGEKYLILPGDKDALFQEVLAAVRSNQWWQVTGIRTLEGRLDEVFRELTS